MPVTAMTKIVSNLIGHSIMGVYSANLKITRGLGEVARRFVGDSSLDDADKAAKESSKTDDSFVHFLMESIASIMVLISPGDCLTIKVGQKLNFNQGMKPPAK